MRVITTRERIATVAERWKKQYYHGSNGWIFTTSGPSNDVYKQLRTLPESATEQDVIDIIGNTSWTRLTCDECGANVASLIIIGQPPDIESDTAAVCLDCLQKATALLAAAR